MPEVNANYYPGGIYREGNFTVPVDRYIVNVTRECYGPYCGWCYNPAGGYDISYTIESGGTVARWRRLYGGLPVEEYYNVYWKFRP
jgi:hypothetical protein